MPAVSLLTGDTWVDTPPSDPLLAAQFRALMRARRQCIATNPTACPANPEPGSAFYNFSRFLIKNIEHDWGPSGSFPTTGSGGAPTDCGAVKSFAGVHGHGRFWRWTISKSHDGSGPTIHWLQMGDGTKWADMTHWNLTGLSYSTNWGVDNLKHVGGSSFWNADRSNAGQPNGPWVVTIDAKTELTVSRFECKSESFLGWTVLSLS